VIEITKFALAGNATFTVTSRKTGTRFTFKVRQLSETAPHFVSLMNGPDNESSYCFLGSIFNGDKYFHGKKSRVTPDAPSAKAFAWLWAHRNDPDLTEKVEIHHEGRCCRCGRKLTVPESIESGIGPECAGKAGW
jgi:hypothetical protein